MGSVLRWKRCSSPFASRRHCLEGVMGAVAPSLPWGSSTEGRHCFPRSAAGGPPEERGPGGFVLASIFTILPSALVFRRTSSTEPFSSSGETLPGDGGSVVWGGACPRLRWRWLWLRGGRRGTCCGASRDDAGPGAGWLPSSEPSRHLCDFSGRPVLPVVARGSFLPSS